MPFIVKMPKLSPTMEEGAIAKWHKKEGDFVKEGELLLEITTDKATVEHTALDEGWLRQTLQQEGVSVNVNAPIAVFTEEENESLEGFEVEKPKAPTAAPLQTEELSQETPKKVVERASIPSVSHTPEPPLESYVFEAPQSPTLASPLAKRLAKEQSLDLSTVKGSGPGGRITSKDLQKAQPKGIVTFGSTEKPTIPPGTYEEEPLSPIRKVIARRLQESKSSIPHFYVKQEVDASGIITLKEQLAKAELKLTYNDFVIRAAALALKKHPHLNAGFNSESHAIVRFKTIDISVAVSTDDGLITPIIRHADYKNVGQLSLEMKALGKKAKAGKLAQEEYKGGSFCISNLGMFGVTEFTAVINPPQAAILAVGGIEEKAVVKDGKVVAGKTMMLTLSVDHRVIDGADAALFIKTVQALIEAPSLLLV